MRMLLLLLLAAAIVVVAQDRNLDRFNYDVTVKDDTHIDFGPEDWDRVQCPDLDSCLGWPDTWEMAHGWELGGNHCRSCPASADNDNGSCGAHHQSPIDLRRNRAIATSDEYNECIDVHWMAYFDSSCSFDDLKAKNAFVIDRHALRIIQPVKQVLENSTITYKLNCPGRRWGRIDFSKGFSHWWHLSHIDFHVPSEHTQEGKRYDAELHMYHFYSLSGEDAGIDNEMASVTMFLQAYDDAPDYPILNRIICAWRETEEKTRASCGLDSVETEYPGCFYYRRGHDDDTNDDFVTTTQEAANERRTQQQSDQQQQQQQQQARRRRQQETILAPPAKSAHDVILHNHHHMAVNSTYQPETIEMDPVADFEDMSDFDWDAFIAEQYAAESKVAATTTTHHGRKLLNYDHVPWFNYFPMIGVKTEYYYRYSGTQTIPPCYGKWFSNNNRQNTNHWRIMKDPIRVSHRQIAEMHRLLRNRIAPQDDPLAKCQPDTAGKLLSSNKISTARPLQSTHKAHFKVFCECQDWRSKWEEDKEWCQIQDQMERYYDHPYNFKTNGF